MLENILNHGLSCGVDLTPFELAHAKAISFVLGIDDAISTLAFVDCLEDAVLPVEKLTLESAWVASRLEYKNVIFS